MVNMNDSDWRIRLGGFAVFLLATLFMPPCAAAEESRSLLFLGPRPIHAFPATLRRSGRLGGEGGEEPFARDHRSQREVAWDHNTGS